MRFAPYDLPEESLPADALQKVNIVIHSLIHNLMSILV